MASPFYEEDENDPEALPPPHEFSDRSVSRSDTCSSADSQRHLRPTPVIPEVITTEYSDQTSSAEDLLSADDASQIQSDSQLLDNDREKKDVEPSSSLQQNHGKQFRSLSPSLEMLDEEEGHASSLEGEERKKEANTQVPDANLLDTETTGMSSSAPDLLSMTSEELQWIQSGGLNQQSCSTDGLEMESIVEHRTLLQKACSASPTSDERTETNMDSSNASAEDDFIMVSDPCPNDTKTEEEEEERELEKEDSVSPSPRSPSSRKTGSTSSTDATSTSGDGSIRTPTPGASQRLKSHRRSLSTSEVDILKDVHKLSEGGHDSANPANGWKPMADISEVKSSQNLNKSATSLVSDSLKGGDLDERSRASSLRTNDTCSPHESEESSEDDMEDDFLSAKESHSKTSLDPLRSNSPSASDLLEGRDHVSESTREEKVSELKPPQSLAGVILRNKKGLGVSHQANRYSADLIISRIDDYIEENDEDVLTPTSLAALSHRRINSTSTSMMPPSSASDYQLHQHLSSAGGEQNRESTSAGTSSTTSQELHLLTVTSPQQKDKESVWSNDSVFEQEGDVLNTSDIDIKVASDGSVVQSLESSLDHSLSSSLQFEPGSSNSIKKRARKSPLLYRKSPGDKESSPSTRRKGGLTKEDVEPTIKTLRVLLSQENIEDRLSDDETSLDKGPAGLQRTPSNGSNSVTFNTEDPKQSSPSTTSRFPLSPTVDCSIVETECTSLDFIPGSPIAVRRQAQLAEQAPHPPSPLSFYHTKSPLGTSQSTDSERKVTPSSPNSIPSSPVITKKVQSEIKLSQGEGREEDDELTSLKSVSEVAISKPHKRVSLKMRQVMSFDEGAGGSQPYTELLGDMGETAKEHSEEELSDPKLSGDITVPTGKESDWGIKRVFNRDLFRRSKGNKKVPKVKKSGEAEQVSDSATSLAQKQTINRPKSAARVQSSRVNHEAELKDDEMTFMTPEAYSSYREKQQQQEARSGSGADVQRSVSMQVKLNHSGHSRSSSVQINAASYVSRLPRRTSDDTLASPQRAQSEGQTLSPLQEEMNALGSPTHIEFQTQPSGESDTEEVLHEAEQLISNVIRNPVLAIPDEISWDKTVNRKIYKKMNKTERDRQSILHELLQTEKRYFRVLHILKLIFRQTLSKHVSEEALNSMFPELNNLIEISNNFSRKLESKCDGMIFEDCSEILLKQFSGEMYTRTLESFGNFCSVHLTAMEVYKEHLKKKHFARIMKDLHSLKECQRLTLPDYYTHVSQHLSKILTLLKRLTNKTEALKLDHAPRLRQALQQLEMLMSGVNRTVEYHKNRMELMHIQERLEVVNVPKSVKITNRKDLKNLSLVAYDRMLRKSGEATWIGHGKQLGKSVCVCVCVCVCWGVCVGVCVRAQRVFDRSLVF